MSNKQTFNVTIDQQQYNSLSTSLTNINNNLNRSNNIISNNITRELNTQCSSINLSVQNLHKFQQETLNNEKFTEQQLIQKIHDLFGNQFPIQNYNLPNLAINYFNPSIQQI